ncbi:Major facilitator transporter, partial [human gut metagenome]
SGLSGPGFTAGGSLAVTAAEQGGVAGVLNATGSMTWIVAPVTATALYGWQPLAPFVLSLVVLSISTLLAWTRLERRRATIA